MSGHDPVAAVRDGLLPHFRALLDALDADNAQLSAGFFRSGVQRLEAARSEADLMEFFIEHLSTSAFVVGGDSVGRRSLELLDTLLEAAEHYSAAFSASGAPH